MSFDEYTEALETARPAHFVPTDMEELKQYLAVLIREHVRACYRSQAEAAVALGTTQPRVSQCVTGQLRDISAERLLDLAIRAGLIRRIEVRVE